MSELADPFNPQYWFPQRPPDANHGTTHWAASPEDLVEVFENLAESILAP